ncbi:hypothetical protein KPSB59_4260018 [Klebsiella quasipneumoniae subsp. quasipneumoniae]|nr:hypothetical protein KPSB59_4260018 [Klebsiella quasipneumoniae subsp. quasipneumoniae]
MPELFSLLNPRKYFCPLPHFYGPCFFAPYSAKNRSRKNLKTVMLCAVSPVLTTNAAIFTDDLTDSRRVCQITFT